MVTLGRLAADWKARILFVLHQCTRDMLRALLSVPVLLLLALVLVQYGSQIATSLGRDGVYSVSALAAVVTLAVGLLFSATIKRKHAWNPLAFLLCSLVAALTIYYVYITSIEVVWVSDFETMWQRAVDMVASGDYEVRSIYDGRALPVLVPIVLLFGPNPAVVPIVNLAFLLGIQMLGYDLARRIAGHQAAQGFTVLWVAAMEPIFALPITSHDIWGLFFLVLFLWGLRATSDRVVSGKISSLREKSIIAFSALALACVLVLLEIQRALALFVILAFILASLLSFLRREPLRPLIKPVVRIAAAIFLLYGGITVGLRHAHYMLSGGQGTEFAQIRSSSLSSGTYRQGQFILRTFFHGVDSDSREELGGSILLSDFTLQPLARLGNIIFRASEQAHLGSQTGFYQAHAKSRWKHLIPLTRSYNACYSILLAWLSFWWIVPLARRMDSIDGLTQFAFLSTLVGGLLFVGESQPRYIFPIWFILPQLIVFGTFLRPASSNERLAVPAAWGLDITRGALLLLVGFLVLAISSRCIYGEADGRILSGWQPTLHGATETAPRGWFDATQTFAAGKIKKESRDRRTTVFGDLALVMKIPVKTRQGGSMNVDKLLCTNTDRRALDFYYYMPYQNLEANAAFKLEVLLDGKQRWSAFLPGTVDVAHAHIRDMLPASTCGKLEIRLVTNRDLTSQSWIDASQTELYFLRLAH